MAFADLKNDFVFRRIFATHPEILCGLLNDLLDRTGDETIASIEYLPSEQLPLVQGAKLSILDVRCKDRAGTKFVVEMQLIHVAGFINRVIYNGCKAYADQLKAGEAYGKLTDVVAISICDFALWPDAEQDQKQLPRIPMLSRWYMTESHSSDARRPEQEANRLLHVQYAFLELAKLPSEKPTTGALQWAWLFVHAPELASIPTDLPDGPYRSALELANEATFTQLELDAYRKVMDEIQQAREYGDARDAAGDARGEARGLAKGLAVGLAKGKAEGKAEAIVAILAARGIALDEASRALITGCSDATTLDGWLVRAISASAVEEVVNPS